MFDGAFPEIEVTQRPNKGKDRLTINKGLFGACAWFRPRASWIKITATNMLMRHLPLPLPMDTNSSDERNILSGGATMPVPYHLDESDSESIVSSIFSFIFFWSFFHSISIEWHLQTFINLYSKYYALMDVTVLIFSPIKLCIRNAQPVFGENPSFKVAWLKIIKHRSIVDRFKSSFYC